MEKKDIMKKFKKQFSIRGKKKNVLVYLVSIEKINITRDQTIYDANYFWEEWDEYNEQGDIILERKIGLDGLEKTIVYENTYFNNGNLKHWKNSDGEEMTFDENGRLIYSKAYGGHEYWAKNTSDSTEDEFMTDYDENGNEIHWKRSDGLEQWNDYDENGNLIHIKDNEGEESWYEYEFDGEVKTIYSYHPLSLKDMLYELSKYIKNKLPNKK